MLLILQMGLIWETKKEKEKEKICFVWISTMQPLLPPNISTLFQTVGWTSLPLLLYCHTLSVVTLFKMRFHFITVCTLISGVVSLGGTRLWKGKEKKVDRYAQCLDQCWKTPQGKGDTNDHYNYCCEFCEPYAHNNDYVPPPQGAGALASHHNNYNTYDTGPYQGGNYVSSTEQNIVIAPEMTAKGFFCAKNTVNVHNHYTYHVHYSPANDPR